jgi:hypothetical protein
MNEDVKAHHKMIKNLNKRLNHDLATAEGFYEQGVVIAFANGFNLFVNPFKGEYKATFSTKGLLVIQDPGLKNLNKVLKNDIKSFNYENGSKFLFQIIKAFSKNERKNVLKNYQKVYHFELRDLLNSYFKLGLDPRKEFFLYGNDQLSPRFHQVKELKIGKGGIKVKIEDRSAILFNTELGRVLDLDSGMFYKTKSHIYLNKIFHHEECSEKDATEVRHSGNAVNYFKMVLNENVNLKNEKRFAYQSADKMKFTLKKDSKGIYSLWDDLGKIEFAHPDLLFRVI